jgi:hypothetical protein
MREPDLAIAGFYDHEQERRAPDWGGDDLFTGPGPRRRRFERAVATPAEPVVASAVAVAVPPPAPAPERYAYMEPVPAGRRTVTITGRPEGMPRRPARTLDERIAHRPERLASYTCGLGFLSILLAIVTAQ